eukprot:Skav206801  [mRNA]  locus=scaffold1990:174081:175014:+ [translate_table: standard]
MQTWFHTIRENGWQRWTYQALAYGQSAQQKCQRQNFCALARDKVWHKGKQQRGHSNQDHSGHQDGLSSPAIGPFCCRFGTKEAQQICCCEDDGEGQGTQTEDLGQHQWNQAVQCTGYDAPIGSRKDHSFLDSDVAKKLQELLRRSFFSGFVQYLLWFRLLQHALIQGSSDERHAGKLCRSHCSTKSLNQQSPDERSEHTGELLCHKNRCHHSAPVFWG